MFTASVVAEPVWLAIVPMVLVAMLSTLAVGLVARLPQRRLASLVALAAALTLLAHAPPPDGLPRAMLGLAVVLTPIILWAVQLVPAWSAAVVFFVLAVLTELAPPLHLFSGFWSNAAMLSLGGIVIGTAADRSGLGPAIARGLIGRFLGSYARFLLGILVGTSALSFIIPTTLGRLAIAIPIVAAAAREAGYAAGSNGFNGALILTVVGNFLTSSGVLTANLVGVIAVGAAENVHGVTVRYGEYLLMCAPVLFLLKGLSIHAIIVRLLPAPRPVAITSHEPVRLGLPARRLAVVMAATVALWATDVLHGMKPGWVAMLGAVACMLPPVAIVHPRELVAIDKLTVTLTLAAVLGVAIVLDAAGTGRMFARLLLATVPLEGGSPAAGFVGAAVMGAAISVVATTVGSIAIVTPVLASVQAATGLDAKIGLVGMITGLQAIVMPYQSTPIMIGLMMAKIAPGVAIRILVPVAITGMLVILPLEIAWLKLCRFMP